MDLTVLTWVKCRDEQGLVVTKTDLVDKYTFYFPQILVDRFDGSLYLNRKLELQ